MKGSKLNKVTMLVVVLGAWLENPERDPQVQEFVKRVRNLDRGGKKPFYTAGIWQITLR